MRSFCHKCCVGVELLVPSKGKIAMATVAERDGTNWEARNRCCWLSTKSVSLSAELTSLGVVVVSEVGVCALEGWATKVSVVS